ncbi:hypothetical protein [Enterococcus devriesei]|uniref:hypothetical protein n=1 Tax=Enterococcus devriesei TaxID=319970 RepID=UPI0028B0116D|nr:hypothetical protein [Enterococcus devriesei]
MGVSQPWTQLDGKWYKKVDATIVNAFGAEQDATVEIHIAPVNATSGNVEILLINIQPVFVYPAK